tara:strand:+ start:483 stop:1169 length:687 start_codon:yes stop_codon:yes gene_type:complete
MRILEVINRAADTYNPRPKDAYQDATTNTTPKYEIDWEKDYSAGKPLGPIPNIQSQTEMVSMPDGTIYIFYTKDGVLPKETFWQQIKSWFKKQTFVNADKSILGFLKLKPYEEGYKVSGVGIDPSIQGQGKAIKLYVAFTAWKGVPIYSDYTQTPSAKRVWQSLISRYPNRIVAYDQKTKQDIPLDKAGELYHDYTPISPDHPERYRDQTHSNVNQTHTNTLLLKLLP